MGSNVNRRRPGRSRGRRQISSVVQLVKLL
uniref:Uncharacterized protein n=1 Tax=Anguilla anguilla TaxID=7936 RepID=A0A0E9V7A7_ANGAN